MQCIPIKFFKEIIHGSTSNNTHGITPKIYTILYSEELKYVKKWEIKIMISKMKFNIMKFIFEMGTKFEF